MNTRYKTDWFCRASTTMAFLALFAIGQCVAPNAVSAPAQRELQALNEPEIPATDSGQSDANASNATKFGFMTDRVKERGRKFPLRDDWTAFKIAKHVNGVFGGLEQGAGPGFGVELTTADSIPGIEFRAIMLTSDKLYRRFEGEIYIPKIGDDKTHADFWYGYLRRTEDNFFGIGPWTPLRARTNFDVERRSINGGLYRDFNEDFQAGIYASYINSNAYDGKGSKSPSIDTVFSGDPSVEPFHLWAPGLHSGSKVITYGIFGEYDRRNYESGLTQGFYFYGRFGSVDGLNKGKGTFSDYGWFDSQLDARGYIPIISDKTSLALRIAANLKSVKAGSQIPFYDMSFLGGFNYVRGFNTYRYRDNNALISNLELRQTVYSFKKRYRGIDMIGFGDAGQVWGNTLSSMVPDTMSHNYFANRNWKAGIGGGIQYRHTKSLTVRIDVATSADGERIYFSASRGF
jgi:outer membrane protein assembly factor BamA